MAAWLGLAGAGILIDAAQAAGGLKVVVILDNSGSMKQQMPQGGSRIDAAKQSLLTVLDQTPDGAEVGVLLLNPARQGPWLIPLGPVDRQSVRAAVHSISANGPTPLGGSLKLAADALLELRETQRYGTYKLLVVTDGEATDGNLVDQYLPEVQARGILMDVIGVAMPGQSSLAKQANTYRRADDPESLEKAISAVVLGESADGAGGDTGESDFELLAPLPVEVAAASLAALTSRQNLPIGGSGQDRQAQRNSPNRDWGQPPAGVNPPNAPQPVDEDEGGSLVMLVLGAILVFFVVRIISSIGKGR